MVNTSYTFDMHKEHTSPILSNAWLSGFIDADGSFNINIRSKKADGSGKDRVEVRMRLEQRQTDPLTGMSYQPVLSAIATALGVVLGTSVHNHNVQYYIISTSSPAKLSVLINYLNKYPLFSGKRMNYNDFKVCHSMMLNKSHLTATGREEIALLKAGMNSTRTYFNWDHLDLLYNY